MPPGGVTLPRVTGWAPPVARRTVVGSPPRASSASSVKAFVSLARPSGPCASVGETETETGARATHSNPIRVEVQAAAAATGLDVAGLDRPNPLGGAWTEGRTLDPSCAAFVGVHPVPVRHGPTLGELAALVAAKRG